MNLRDFIGKHITIVVVRGHAEASFGPTDDLHRGCVRYKVLEFAVRDETGVNVLLLVVFVEHFLHNGPAKGKKTRKEGTYVSTEICRHVQHVKQMCWKSYASEFISIFMCEKKSIFMYAYV
jgi:fructose-1,6-bisphosphatase